MQYARRYGPKAQTRLIKIRRSQISPWICSAFFLLTHHDRETCKARFGATIGASVLNKQERDHMSNENQNNFVRQQDAGIPGNGFASGVQAIASAYGDYTKKSFEDTKAFVERLSSVRSIDKVVEVQTEFARAAYETFVGESQKIAALYGDLAKQTYGGFVSKLVPLAFKS